MSISTFKRYEKKYIVKSEKMTRLIPSLLEHMNYDAFCVGGREYGVYNVYYDTPDDYLIRESLEKPYYKEKFRIRSYHSPAGPDDTIFLEIKKKIGGIVAKRRATMNYSQAKDFIEKGICPSFDEKDYINKQVIREIEVFLNSYNISPKQYVGYQRMAFFGKDNKSFRLTFDREITTRRDGLSLAQPCYGKVLLPSDLLLMEIKISDTLPLWLSHLLSELEIFRTSFSKYGRAYKNYAREDPKGTLICAAKAAKLPPFSSKPMDTSPLYT